MDIIGSKCHLFVNNSSRGLEDEEPAFRDDCICNALFINYAVVAWHEMRRAWRGDEFHLSQRMPREPIIRCTTTYEELLLSKEPFDKPVPLSASVELVTITALATGGQIRD